MLCAQLRTKYWHGKPKPQGHDKPHGKSDDKPGKADDKPNGKSDDAPGQAEDKQRGKSEDAPGQAEDKQRGKSDDAPGQRQGQGQGQAGPEPPEESGPPRPGRGGSSPLCESRAAVSSQRCSAAWPVSVTSPSASIQSRTRSSRTRPSASLGPGPLAAGGQRARAGLDRPAAGVQRRERAALVLGRHVQRVRAGAGRERRPRRVGGARLAPRRPRLPARAAWLNASVWARSQLAGVVHEALGTVGVDAELAGDVLQLAALDALDPAGDLVGDRAQRLLEGLRLVFVAHAER